MRLVCLYNYFIFNRNFGVYGRELLVNDRVHNYELDPE